MFEDPEFVGELLGTLGLEDDEEEENKKKDDDKKE